ncbi:MAG: class I SAM-dependent methyltransferase [Candidatus Loosdrechtia sp.]|uniref:class I SAM-dependent methyltransferase n=1 Tax=Candidatus Loosdrechtia sp. TaxID=3101272 RepID=UPI003A633CBA|nr:MAG: class I SAM-dependent methyltransferase [Candidatus Jettenia sp. AMX2]
MANYKKCLLCAVIFLYIIPYTLVLNTTVLAKEQDRLFWNERYNVETYVYQKEPADFLREHVDILPKGKALDIAMGEGRNAVFLAKNGFEVEGCDISEVAISKAYKLAEENGVTIHAFTADLETYKLPENTYDVIICFYYLQRDLIPQIKNALKPGGVVVYETYTLENLEHGFGGPKNREYLLGQNELLRFFIDFQVIFYREIIINNKKVVASIIARK